MRYFSEAERGPRARTGEELGQGAWGGVVAQVTSLIGAGAFGAAFPAECEDGGAVYGNNEHTFALALKAEIPDIEWPLHASTVPPTLTALDLLQFCLEHVAKPEPYTFHSFFRHDHLNFDRDAGRADFIARVERIFSRNGLAYELQTDGQVVRIAPDGIREALDCGRFETGDSELDALLEGARTKFLSPDPTVRRDSLEKLWDAFERLKSLGKGKDKKAAIEAILKQAAPEATFRARLDTEARELTDIGNKFRIRHSETTQVPLELDQHVDYLFHRLFGLLQLLVRTCGPF